MSGKLTDELQRFFDGAEYPILFTGAGVSARAGMPTWSGYVEYLAQSIRSEDALTAQQMLELVKSGDFTHAVEYFRLSKKVLDGDKRKWLKKPLDTYDASKIASVAKLPFRACLTTNFDRSMNSAISASTGIAASDYKLGDASFKQAIWDESIFVARIHGAVETPDSMILSSSQFNALRDNDDYAEVLRACFLHRNVIFLGFSFYDPAVQYVFNSLDKKFGSASSGRHVALLPDTAGGDFLQKANRLNIKVVSYNSANNHEELWSAVDEFSGSKRTKKEEAKKKGDIEPLGFTKRYLASCYARSKTKSASAALRESVLEGIVSAILQEAYPSAVDRNALLDRVRLAIGIKGSEIENSVTAAIDGLAAAGLCHVHRSGGGKYAWKVKPEEESSLNSSIATLTKSVMQRANLQEGWVFPEKNKGVITTFFKRLIRQRGWDLGVSFATGRIPDSVAVDSLLVSCASTIPAYDKERLLRVLDSVLRHPSEEEAEILVELGKLSFAIELAFQSPQTVFLHDAILPRNIYFDANVLLPALVEGHPFSQIYLQAISKLKEASSRAALNLSLKVCSVYLNEIISHRRNAEEYARQSGVDFESVVKMDTTYHGSSNVNVFVGGYANWLQKNQGVSFSDYLKEYAPYETEAELSRWLQDSGFDIVYGKKESRYGEFNLLLEVGYSGQLSYGKKPILVEHDAIQLSILDLEIERGEKTIFVSADRQLQQIVFDSRFVKVAELMVSHVGLIQLIDLLLGGVSDSPGFIELLWSTRISDRAQSVRAYFTSKGLEQYDEGMAMAMPKIIETYTRIAAQELKTASADLDTDEPAARAKAFRTLGMLERNYIQSMHDALEKLKSENL